MTSQTLNQQARSEQTSPKQLAELARMSASLARLVARNPNCSQALLRKLGSHKDDTVRKWVTVHPNTPPEVRLALAQQFPRQLLDNPMLDLLLLENPNLFEDMPIGTVRALMKRPNLPAGFIRFAVTRKDENVQLAIAQNRSTPPEIIAKLKTTGLSQAVCTAAQAWEAPEPGVEEAKILFWHAFNERLVTQRRVTHYPYSNNWRTLYKSLLDSHPITGGIEAWNDAVKTAADPKTSDAVQANLANHPYCLVQEALLARESLSEAAALTLARLEAPNINMDMARRRTMFPSVLALLAEISNSSVHSALARNPSTPALTLASLVRFYWKTIFRFPGNAAKVLDHLMGDANSTIREDMAKYSRTPASVLERLAQDSNASVRRAVARNSNTPASVLMCLAEDSDVLVRESLVDRSYRLKHDSVLERLAEDPEVYVRVKVAKYGQTVSALERLAKDPEVFVRLAVAQNDRTPSSTLERLAGDSEVCVRRAVAYNGQTPVSVSERLVEDLNAPVRYELAKTTRTPASVLALLAEGRRADFPPQRAERANPRTPIFTLLRLSMGSGTGAKIDSQSREEAFNPGTPVATLERLAEHQCNGVRINVALNPNTPATVLERLAVEKSVRIRCVVAAHPNTPDSVLETLATEKFAAVRLNVARNHKTSTALLRFLAMDKNTKIRLAVAQSPNTPASILETLATDKKAQVRQAVAENPNTPAHVLKRLATDKSLWVRNTVEENQP